MAVGVCGVHGVTVPAPVAEVCNTLSAPVITRYLRTEASTVRAKGSSIAPATQRPALIPTVRHCSTVIKKKTFFLCLQASVAG